MLWWGRALVTPTETDVQRKGRGGGGAAGPDGFQHRNLGIVYAEVKNPEGRDGEEGGAGLAGQTENDLGLTWGWGNRVQVWLWRGQEGEASWSLSVTRTCSQDLALA